jgi:hypothetical protein
MLYTKQHETSFYEGPAALMRALSGLAPEPITEVTDENEPANPVDEIRKLFAPKETINEAAAQTVATAFARAIASGDDFYAALDAGLQPLVYPELLPSSPLSKTASEWETEMGEPLTKRAAQLTYRTRVDEDGSEWIEGFDASGEMQSAYLSKWRS